MSRILLVEDEEDLRFSLAHNLSFDGHEVITAETGDQGLKLATTEGFDLIILDIMLPGVDGLEILKAVRLTNESVPVMMLTAKGAEMDKVIGFELGADDYLTKPFSLGELLARVKALLRRGELPCRTTSHAVVRFYDVAIDFENYTLHRKSKEVHFSQKEFLLLKYLIQRANQAVEKSDILNAVWGYTDDATTRTIDTHIARIRRKLDDQNQNRIIRTVPTVGYKFVAPIESP